MEITEIMLIVAVVEVGQLEDFDVEELSEFWSALTVCMDDEYFFATFNDKQKTAVKEALKKVENELKHRGGKPVNFFKLIQEDPSQVEYYLKQFDLNKLLELAGDLKEFEKSQVVADLLKLVNKRIYQLIPVA
ncbi:MAG: hypothetical protein IJS88_06410 [Alphaproteobacteria bacterium]|nr:hypothetical protein [Alphaproteobacteria bacterium]